MLNAQTQKEKKHSTKKRRTKDKFSSQAVIRAKAGPAGGRQFHMKRPKAKKNIIKNKEKNTYE